MREIQEEERRVTLQENEENLSRTIQSKEEEVIVTNREGYIEGINSIAQRLTGWSTDAFGRRTREVFSLYHSLMYEPISDPVDYVLETKSTERPISFNASPMRDSEGEFCGVIMVFSDPVLPSRNFLRTHLME